MNMNLNTKSDGKLAGFGNIKTLSPEFSQCGWYVLLGNDPSNWVCLEPMFLGMVWHEKESTPGDLCSGTDLLGKAWLLNKNTGSPSLFVFLCLLTE